MTHNADYGAKRAYVKRQGQSRNHTCHWPGCERQVPPAMWGCKPHWFKLPYGLRALIWATYEIGQEATMTPSEGYLDAAQQVQEWIEQSAHNDGSGAASGSDLRVNEGAHVQTPLSDTDSGEAV